MPQASIVRMRLWDITWSLVRFRLSRPCVRPLRNHAPEALSGPPRQNHDGQRRASPRSRSNGLRNGNGHLEISSDSAGSGPLVPNS